MGKSADQDGRKTRATLRRQQRRSQIIAAARNVFSEKGYHQCSVADILKEARIARGTFYLYFPSKRALFDHLLDQMFSQITSAVRRITTEPGDDSALDQMFGNVRRIIDVLESNRELTIILLREAVGLDADLDQKLTAFYERISLRIERALRLGQEMRLIRPCEVRLVSSCVLGGFKEVMLKVLTAGLDPNIEREVLAREILDYNLRGIFIG